MRSKLNTYSRARMKKGPDVACKNSDRSIDSV
jgi:hypothetical protein